MKIIRGSVVGLAGAVGLGVLAWPATAGWAAAGGDTVYKRDEQVTDLVLVADDDDDDTNRERGDTRSRTGTGNSGRSRDTGDHTRSNFTAVSRDRDLSRGDKTRDWTRDGGDRTRDHSANHTNDGSRNDTRR